MLKKISIVIPCYNEEETIAIIYKELVQVDRKLQDFYFEYIFINDGSTDDTLLKLRQLSKKKMYIIYRFLVISVRKLLYMQD